MLSWQGVVNGVISVILNDTINGNDRKGEAGQKLGRKAWKIYRSLEKTAAFSFILNFLSVTILAQKLEF